MPLLPLSDLFDVAPNAVLRAAAPGKRTPTFSASVVCDEELNALGIVFNDLHEQVRQRADIAHECAHLHLRHRPSKPNLGEPRGYPEKEEAEAHWLGPALLVPRDGLVERLRRDPSLSAAAAHFEVSRQLVQMRYNLTGCKRIVAATT